MRLLETIRTNKTEALLAALLVLILLSPVIEETGAPNNVLGIVSLPVMIAAVLHASTSKIHCAIAIVIASAWICLRFLLPDTAGTPWPYGLYALLLGVVAYAILGHIFRATRVDRSLIASAITVYLLLGAIWGDAYLAIYLINPAAFGAPNVDPNYASVHFLYYSYVTLTTLGFGDIKPISPTARILSATEAITGVLYIAILIARLVSLLGRDPSGPHTS